MTPLDLRGKRFGRLLVLHLDLTRGGRNWVCRCDCGRTTVVHTGALRKGNTKSCGCFRLESIKKTNTRHGYRKHPLYHVWRSMKARCRNVRNIGYSHYGGRGIEVCSEWETFEGFFEDMGSGYVAGFTLERLDVEKGYDKENCTWASTAEQARNKRNTVRVGSGKDSALLLDVCRRYGVSYTTVWGRVSRGGGRNEP